MSGLRALIEEAIVVAAALTARDDLDVAAASTQRLGGLTSGMWRALSRELATAAARLDSSTMERLDDIHRRAGVLQVEVDDVLRAGEAAAHLAEHTARIETLLGPDDPGRRLLGPNLLFGFGLDSDDDDDRADLEDDAASRLVRATVFFWPEPLTPATVTIVASLPTDASLATDDDVAFELTLDAPPLLHLALSTATELSTDDLNQALTQLGQVCWIAHTLDELPPDEDEDEDEDADDDEPDDV